MIAVDTNILVYAHRAEMTFHREAHDCIRELAEGAAPWAIPWPCVFEFLNIATHPRIFDPPTRLGAALDQISCWLESPSVVLLGDAPGLWPVLMEQARRGRVTGRKIHDAHIASLCLHHGVKVLWSADRHFGRFPALRVTNPLL